MHQEAAVAPRKRGTPNSDPRWSKVKTKNSGLPESPLLVVRGSPEAVRAGEIAGADAARWGGRVLTRGKRQKLHRRGAARAPRDSHARGVRVYVTLNIVLYDREPEALVMRGRFMRYGRRCGYFCADMGLITLMQKYAWITCACQATGGGA